MTVHYYPVIGGENACGGGEDEPATMVRANVTCESCKLTHPHIIVSGNPVDGLSFEGPYDSHDEAVAAADEVSADWWIAPLTPPIGG